MPHITTCTKCGKGYEEHSEEAANAPERLCFSCWDENNYRYDDEPCCIRCDGEGVILTCVDDMCHGLGYCIHGYGESMWPDCKGKGWIGPEDHPTVW